MRQPSGELVGSGLRGEDDEDADNCAQKAARHQQAIVMATMLVDLHGVNERLEQSVEVLASRAFHDNGVYKRVEAGRTCTGRTMLRSSFSNRG